jgi:biotin carboxyl carrier protein
VQHPEKRGGGLMRHAFTIAEVESDVFLTRAHDGYRLHIEDRTIPVALDRAALLFDGAPHAVEIAVDGDLVHVHLDGETHTVRYTDPVKRHAGHGAGSADDVASAPMPGTVIAANVAPGQAVARGDTLLVIESMKLETAIKAWRDGTVAAVHVAVGQTFDRGAPLVALAPEAGG